MSTSLRGGGVLSPQDQHEGQTTGASGPDYSLAAVAGFLPLHPLLSGSCGDGWSRFYAPTGASADDNESVRFVAGSGRAVRRASQI